MACLFFDACRVVTLLQTVVPLPDRYECGEGVPLAPYFEAKQFTRSGIAAAGQRPIAGD